MFIAIDGRKLAYDSDGARIFTCIECLWVGKIRWGDDLRCPECRGVVRHPFADQVIGPFVVPTREPE